MELIIGGAYQGKTAYAKETFGLKEEQVRSCPEDALPDWSAPCLRHLENFALFCVRQGKQPEREIALYRDLWKDSVLLCDDISCGVVPMEAETRAWREGTGRMLAALSREANTVTRLFCGLPQRLK